MMVALLDDLESDHSAPPSPTLISLHEPKPVRRFIDTNPDEDYGILTFDLDTTRPFKSQARWIEPRCSTHPLTPSIPVSSLRPSAVAFIPRNGVPCDVTATLPDGAPRIRKSGTAIPLFVDTTDDPPSYPVARPASFPPSPLTATRRRNRSSRSASPLSLSTSSSPALSRPSTPLDLSRSPSIDSLPELEDDKDAWLSPPTSTSSRATPLAVDAPGIVFTSEEDIARLFIYDFQPAKASGGDHILVDFGENVEKVHEVGKIVETYKEDREETVLVPGRQLDQPDDPRRKPLGDHITSVRPVGDLLIESIDEIDRIEPHTATTTPTLRPHPQHPRLIKSKPVAGEQDKTGTLLVDLSDPGMSRSSPDRFLKSVYNMAQQTPARQASRPNPGRPGPGPGSNPRAGPSRRKNAVGQDADGQLIDIGVPINRTRDQADVKKLRQRMGLGTPPPNGNSSGRRAPPVDKSGIPAMAVRYQGISPYQQLISRQSPRHGIPAHVLDAQIKDPLQHTLMKAWQATEPTKARRSYISGLLEELSVLVNQKLAWAGSSPNKGKRRFEVDVFGSVSWGGETGASGDLDLVILDLQMPYGYHPDEWRVPAGQPVTSTRSTPRTPFQHLPPVYRLRALKQALDDIGMKESFAIVSATTPIVKFTDPGAKLECDVNVNDLGGWYNSSLILHYCLISPYVLRPMVFALKLWAKAFDLNDPSGANGPPTMSSYCLTLMAIAYLQSRRVLPNLQANVRARVPNDNVTEEPDTVWIGWGKDQGTKAHVGFDRSPPAGWTCGEPNLTAAQALRDFFSFFNKSQSASADKSNIFAGEPDFLPGVGKFEYDSEILSVVQGGVAPRARVQGISNREDANLRQRLIDEGMDLEQVKVVMQKRKEEAERKEAEIGKGDKGIQPRLWEDKVLVVQDPFLWSKNCAAGMSKDGWKRFAEAIDFMDDVLKLQNVTFDAVTKNPLPSTKPARTGTPRRGGPFGRRSGGGGGGGGDGGDGGRGGSGGRGGRGGSPASPGVGQEGGRGGRKKPAKSPLPASDRTDRQIEIRL